MLPAASGKKSLGSASAVDVVAKPVKAKKKAKSGGGKPATLTANDTKLLTYFQRALKSGGVVALTGAQISDGSKLPMGSVGISLMKLITLGEVISSARGSYQLGKLSEAAQTEPKSAPAKKMESAVKAKAAKKAVAKTAKKATPVQPKPKAEVPSPAPESATPATEQAALV